MSRFTAVISRRLALHGLAASILAPALTLPARAQAGATTILSVADLHSAYGRLPQLLTAIRAEAANASDLLIVLNGDIFELANPVATRSRGEADLAFLRAIAKLGPVIVNLGNHEPDFVPDKADIVSMMDEAGVTVISNILDARTGNPYAPATTRVRLAGREITAVGIATDNLFTYPEAIRPQLAIPAPVDYAQATLAGLGDAPLVLLSHAGLVADRAILPILPAGSVVIGGHDHLTLTNEAASVYVHGGAWGRTLTRLDVSDGGGELTVSPRRIDVAMDAEGDRDLAVLIGRLEDQHLREEDRAVVGTSPRALDLRESILFAVEAVREAADADLALLGHTTFGASLLAGPVRRYDFDAFVRFDGEIVVAEVDGATLRGILARANQFEAASLDERTGDYVHAADIEIDEVATYRLATNGWTATNQERYLGTRALMFEPVRALTLKTAVIDALSK